MQNLLPTHLWNAVTLQPVPTKLCIIQFEIFHLCSSWHIPCLSSIDNHEIKDSHQTHVIPFPNNAHDINDPPIFLSLSILSMPPMKLLDEYLFNASGIWKSTLFTPTLCWTVDVPNTPRADINNTTLLSFHCPNNTLLTGSNLTSDVPLCDVFGKFRIWEFHPVRLLLTVPQASMLYFSRRRTNSVGAEYRLSI